MIARDLITFARTIANADVRIPTSVDVDTLEITRVATDETARAGDLSWVGDAAVHTREARIRGFRGSAIVCSPDALALLPESVVAIVTTSPKLIAARIIDRFFAPLASIDWTTQSGPTASDARIGSRVRLAPGVVLGPRTVIEDDVSIGPNTCIANATIGPRCSIGANCTIGLPGFGYARDDDKNWVRFPHIGGVVLEADVEIGSNTCIDRGSIGDTIIRRGAKIDNLVHIAHNCDIGEAALVIANSMIGGSTSVGPRAWIAPSSSINNKLTIGDGATVGTGAVVIRDVAAGETVVGNPAKPLDKHS